MQQEARHAHRLEVGAAESAVDSTCVEACGKVAGEAIKADTLHHCVVPVASNALLCIPAMSPRK